MERVGYQLVVAIVAESLVTKVTAAVRDAGGRAVTVLRGRGRDLVRPPLFLGVPIEPGREILFVVIEREKADLVMDAIQEAGRLDQPNRGLSFAVDLTRVDGMIASPPPSNPSGGAESP